MAAPLAVAVLTAGNYLIWLGWGEAPWRVAGLVLGLGLLAALAGRRGHAAAAIAVVPAVTTVCFSLDAAPDSATWALGAALIAVATLIGVTLVSAVATLSRPGPS